MNSSPKEIIARYPKLKDAIWRGWNEIHACVNERKLLLEIYEPCQVKISSRKGVIYTALQEDLKIRLMRVLDKDSKSQSAGLRYVRDCCPTEFNQICRAEDINIGLLDSVADRLSAKRDTTFVHIDKKALGNAAKIWNEDPIKWSEVDAVLKDLEVVYRHFHELLFGEKPPFYDLHGPMPSSNI